MTLGGSNRNDDLANIMRMLQQSLRFGQATVSALELASSDEPLSSDVIQRPINAGIAEFLSDLDNSTSNEKVNGSIPHLNYLLASTYHVEDARLGLAGSSGLIQAVHFVLARVAPRNSRTLLIDRAAHKSVLGGFVTSGFEARWLHRLYFNEHDVLAPISTEQVRSALNECSGIAAVWVTSCTYDGFNAPISELAAICHSHGALLVVDAAWCPAFGALEDAGFPPNAIALGADIVITSLHKKGFAPSQIAAVLFADKQLAEHFDVAADVGYQTTSPNLVLVGVADFLVRELLSGALTEPWRKSLATAKAFCAHVHEAHSKCRVICPSDVGADSGDPSHVLVHVGDLGVIGFDLVAPLQSRDFIVEKATRDTVLLLFGPRESDQYEDRIADLKNVIDTCERLSDAELIATRAALTPPTFLPRREQSVRRALFAPSERVTLEESVGRISAQVVAPYPPGSALLVPGERIEASQIEFAKAVVKHHGRVIGLPKELSAARLSVVIE